ncbi:tRNA (adenosine(37)-N6)-threonylcarbamoyltransferase complex dimerization subunit type 1 TsaB [Mesobacterium pallidum]|uniref:tRNA (adenosine(37)-N6)-threonylcarbamoyltransferase complex dimerization subunit type 1 TsaB n=1 Tax=Mesobacterium pallidum TaxID=2872037 RepID=UPI001EE26D40|nr:tRNA (adenosine(37)-N6)-threonylcarbamoyltransferase complex dimerization subunit type 1 TsaB [Mesobacterium pallidum]
MILAFDTSAAYVAAALCDGRSIVATRHEYMARGQAERLLPLLEELLAEAGIGWPDLDAIGVGIGPGNFTGIRISVAAARGLALSLGIPAIGVNAFDAMQPDLARAVCPAVPGPRKGAYLRDAKTGDIRLAPVEEMLDLMQDVALATPDPTALPHQIARVAAARLATGQPQPRPAPLYVRPADAAPSSDQPPALLDD